MAQVTFTIPDAAIQRIKAALAYKYRDELNLDLSTNQKIAAKFKEHFRVEMVTWLRKMEREIASAQASSTVTPIEVT